MINFVAIYTVDLALCDIKLYLKGLKTNLYQGGIKKSQRRGFRNCYLLLSKIYYTPLHSVHDNLLLFVDAEIN